MSNRPKTKGKVQYGTPAPGAPGAPKTGGEPLGAKIAIGALVVAILVTIVVFALKDADTNKAVNYVSFQSATITGDSLPAMPDSQEQVPTSDPAVGVTIPTVVGKSFDGSSIEIKPGKAQLIAIVAHWCPHCQAEVPKIVEWQANGDISKDVEIIAVSTSVDESKGNFPPASWLEAEGWKNKTLVDTKQGKVLAAFGASGFPTLIAVTADGKVAKRGSGELTLEQVQDLVTSAIEGPTGDSAPALDPEASPIPTTTVAP